MIFEFKKLIKKVGLVLFLLFFALNIQITFGDNAKEGTISFWGMDIEIFEATYAGNANPGGATGTCCPDYNGGTCVIGNYVREGAYYKRNGPCPPPRPPRSN